MVKAVGGIRSDTKSVTVGYYELSVIAKRSGNPTVTKERVEDLGVVRR